MKRILLTLLTGLLASVVVSANMPELFTYDADQMDQELSQLQTLENFIAANPGITLSGMQQEENALLGDLNLTVNDFGGIASLGDEPVLGIPSFLWGCVFGIWGIVIVHLVAEDSVETKKALNGCIVGSVTYAVGTALLYVIYFIIILGSYSYYYY